mgnify:CR=1 FL=1
MTKSAVFWVNVEQDPVFIRVKGRACYLNSEALSRFIQLSIEKGFKRFVVDFSECSGMDSTFLGILAGAALDIKEKVQQGELVLTQLVNRNLELVRNLGLHRVVKVAMGPIGVGASNCSCGLDPSLPPSDDLILRAHQNLVRANPENYEHFQDVISYLSAHA